MFNYFKTYKPTKKQGLLVIVTTAMGLGTPITLSLEGMKLKPYYDSVGVLTVCGGETERVEHRDYTEQECKDRFDVQYGYYSFAVARMYNAKAQSVLNPYIHAAMTDTAYNIGLAAMAKSTMIKELNEGNPLASCNAILLYNKAGGRDCRIRSNNCYGVWDRRLKINKLCLEGGDSVE